MANEERKTYVLDDGTREIPIENIYGEPICSIRIRSGDFSILDRFNELTDDFDKIIEPLKNIQLTMDGESSNNGIDSFQEEWKAIKNVEKEIIDRINELFDTKDAGNLFKNRNAFSTIDGEWYVFKVISMLGEIVKDEMKIESEKTRKRIDKYTKDIERKESIK